MTGSCHELGQEYFERVTRWIAERDEAGDWDEDKRGKKVNRTILCAELDFSLSALTQNTYVRDALETAESRWYGKPEGNRCFI